MFSGSEAFVTVIISAALVCMLASKTTGYKVLCGAIAFIVLFGFALSQSLITAIFAAATGWVIMMLFVPILFIVIAVYLVKLLAQKTSEPK